MKNPLIFSRKPLVFLLLFLSSNVFAEFTLPSAGAKPQGLGNAFIGFSDSPYAMVFNPAGLASITSYELSFSYTGSDSSYDFLGLTLPEKMKGNCGFAVLSRENKAFYFSYGKFLKIRNKSISAGTSIKLFKSKDDGKGLGIDTGILYSLRDNLTFGFVLGNLFRDNFGYGFGLSFKIKSYLFTLDLKEREKSSLYFGLEKKMKKFLVRGGIDDKSLSLGISRCFSGIDIDLSISPFILSAGFEY
ncbi:MAG: hypothetical protein AB1297_04325 [bacterium]